MPYAVHHRRRARPWTAVLAILAVLLSLTIAAANTAAAQSDRRPTAARTSAPPGPATLTVTLRSALDQPMADTQITVYQAPPGWEWSETGTTDATGSVTFDNLPEDEVLIWASDGRITSQVGWTDLVAGPQTVPISLASTRGEVTGTLANAPALADDSWRVCTYEEFIGLGTCVPYDRVNHTFAFTGLAAVPARSHDLFLVPWSNEILARSPLGTVTVTAGTTSHLTPNMAPFVATVRGVVTGTDGAPFAGTVGAHQGLLSPVPATIGTDGRYEVKVLIGSDEQTAIEVRTPSGEVADQARLDLEGGTTTVHNVDLGNLEWASVHGTVIDTAGSTLAGVNIWLCHVRGCSTITAGADGTYVADRVAVGPITAAPYLENYVGQTNTATATTDGEAVTLDLTLRRLTGLPANVVLSGAMEYGDTPALGRSNLTRLTTTGCARGTATYAIDFASTTGVEFTGALTEDPVGAGTYSATLPTAGSYAGLATITVTVTCPDGSTTTTPFDVMYIDPSGTVLDTDGQPIKGAKVVLQHSDSADGPFTDVPDGSDIMSPANRVNPWITGPDGGFKWDVVAGYYRLQVSATGYHVPGSDGAVLTTEAWRIPPEVVGLELVLERASGTLADPTVTVTATPAKAAVGTPVTLRAAITGAAGRPTGTVDFTLDGDPVTSCQDTVVADGIATCTTTPGHAGRARVAAAYGGDAAYAAATGNLDLTIAKGRQSVRFSSLGVVTPGVTKEVLVSMSNSGLIPKVSNDGVASCRMRSTVQARTVHVQLTAVGRWQCSIRVTQAGNADWYPSDETYAAMEITRPGPPVAQTEGQITQIFKRGLRTLTGIPITAGDGSDTVEVYVTAYDANPAKQQVTSVTGGGLSWKRKAAYRWEGRIQEIWTARSERPVDHLIVKATLLRTAPKSDLVVRVVNAPTE